MTHTHPRDAKKVQQEQRKKNVAAALAVTKKHHILHKYEVPSKFQARQF